MAEPLAGLSDDEIAQLARASRGEARSLAEFTARAIVRGWAIEAERQLRRRQEDERWERYLDEKHARAMAPPAPDRPAISRADVVELVHEGLEAVAPFIREHVEETVVEAAEGLDRKLTNLKGRIMGIEDRPHMTYRGVFDLSTRYEAGDVVSRSGTLWHAAAATVGEAPGNGPTAWRMMTKSHNK